MRSNRARPARAARLTCPTQAKQSLPRARKGALRALIAGKPKHETAPGAPVHAQAPSPRSRNLRPTKKGKRRKSVNAFVNRRFFQRMAQWREQLSKRPDAASGLRFFEPEQHGVLRSRGVMTLGLYGVLDINAPGKRSQNKRRLYGESPTGRFGLAPVAAPNPAQTTTRQRPSQGQTETTPRPRRNKYKHNAGSGEAARIKPVEIAKSNRAQAWAPPTSGPDCRANAPCPTSRPPQRSSRARNHDFSFGSLRQRQPICRQASPLGGDDRTIDPAPQSRFGMARHRWALGMAGHLRPGLPADSTPTPAVSAQTDLECRSFGPSPARRPARTRKPQRQRRPRACRSLKILL